MEMAVNPGSGSQKEGKCNSYESIVIEIPSFDSDNRSNYIYDASKYKENGKQLQLPVTINSKNTAKSNKCYSNLTISSTTPPKKTALYQNYNTKREICLDRIWKCSNHHQYHHQIGHDCKDSSPPFKCNYKLQHFNVKNKTATKQDGLNSLVAEHKQHNWPAFIIVISVIEIAVFIYDLMKVEEKRNSEHFMTATHSAAASSLTVAPANILRPVNSLPILVQPSAVSGPLLSLSSSLQNVGYSIPTDSVFIYRPDRRLEVWRFISYMFLHANWLHLGFNIIIQLFYGIPLEIMHGSLRIGVIYLAGVFAGSLGTSVVDSEVYLVGASGGVYALISAHLANITMNYGKMRYALAQLLSVIVFVICDLGYAFYMHYMVALDNNDGNSNSSGSTDSIVLDSIDKDNVVNNYTNANHQYNESSLLPSSSTSNLNHAHDHRIQSILNISTNVGFNLSCLESVPPISYIAHLTGALAGLTIGLLVLKNFEHRSYENVIWWLALGIYCAFTTFAIVFNLINTVAAQLIEEQTEVIAQHLLQDLGVS